MCGPPENSSRTTDQPADITDPAVFAAHYSLAYPRLMLVAAGMIGDVVYAEDIVQEAAIIAFEKSSEFVSGSHFSAWLVEIVRRCALNYRRKLSHRKTNTADPQGFSGMAGGESPAIADLPISAASGNLTESQTAFDDEVIQALGQLSEDSRCCLLLRTILDLSYAEISALMGIPEGTAMSHVHRSKTSLRQSLAAYQSSRIASNQSKHHGTTGRTTS